MSDGCMDGGLGDRTVGGARPVARGGHGLGPVVYRLPSPDPGAARRWAAVVLAACLGVLAVAVWLHPDPRGYGTHAQLFHTECGLIQTLGIPCPSCGMTTAFALTVRGRWLAAFDAQPAGWLLCLGSMAMAGLALSVLISGKSWRLNWYRATPRRVCLLVVGLLLAAWGYKIARMLTGGAAAAGW